MNRSQKNVMEAKAALPWHAWVVGIIFLLYSLAASFDNLMSFIGGENYFKASGMNEMQIAYFSNLPIWVTLGISICIWSGLFASVALLLRRAVSATLFLISIAGNSVYIVYAYLLSDGIAAMGVLWLMPIIITLLMTAMVLYCRRLQNVNILI